MLTKDLVKFKRNKSRIIPDFFNLEMFSGNTSIVEVASKVSGCFKKDSSLKEIKTSLEEVLKNYRSYQKYINCFYKILLDESSFCRSNFYLQRLSLILKAQDIRLNQTSIFNDKIYQDDKDTLFSKEYLCVDDSINVLDYNDYIEDLKNRIPHTKQFSSLELHTEVKNYIDETKIQEDLENIELDIYKDHPDRATLQNSLELSGMDLMSLYNLRLIEYFIKQYTKVDLSLKMNDKDWSNCQEKMIQCKLEASFEQQSPSQIKTNKTNKSKKINFSIIKQTSSSSMDDLLTFLFSLPEDSDVKIYLKKEDRTYFIKLDYSVPFKYYNYKKLINFD